jgi:hypothetical protein
MKLSRLYLIYHGVEVTLAFTLNENTYLDWPQREVRNYRRKGTVHPRTDHEGPEGGRGIALLFL